MFFKRHSTDLTEEIDLAGGTYKGFLKMFGKTIKTTASNERSLQNTGVRLLFLSKYNKEFQFMENTLPGEATVQNKAVINAKVLSTLEEDKNDHETNLATLRSALYSDTFYKNGELYHRWCEGFESLQLRGCKIPGPRPITELLTLAHETHFRLEIYMAMSRTSFVHTPGKAAARAPCARRANAPRARERACERAAARRTLAPSDSTRAATRPRRRALERKTVLRVGAAAEAAARVVARRELERRGRDRCVVAFVTERERSVAHGEQHARGRGRDRRDDRAGDAARRLRGPAARAAAPRVRGVGLGRHEGKPAAHGCGEAEHRARSIVSRRAGAAVPPPPPLRRHSAQTAPVSSVVASTSPLARVAVARAALPSPPSHRSVGGASTSWESRVRLAPAPRARSHCDHRAGEPSRARSASDCPVTSAYHQPQRQSVARDRTWQAPRESQRSQRLTLRSTERRNQPEIAEISAISVGTISTSIEPLLDGLAHIRLQLHRNLH